MSKVQHNDSDKPTGATSPLGDLRWIQGLSQSDVARYVGVHRSTVHYWETGRKEPKPANRMSYAAVLKVSIRQLAEAVYQTVARRRSDSTSREA